ncbi:MAG: hypothetical protein J4O06_12435 [Chloroflexi bacterium]|nr:hypothetical protein [Chloroflexota bacterium]
MTSDIRTWLRDQGFSVRHLAQELGLPITTVEDWVYRGATPSPPNQEKLHTFMRGCTHRWMIEAANGHTSRGVCQHCNEVREFENSIDKSVWMPARRDN